MNALPPLSSASVPAASLGLFAPAPLRSNRSGAARKLNVVIIYDDFAAGERAVRTLMRLKTESAPSTLLMPVPWSFDFLSELPWRSKAIRDVDTADLIILSISQPDEMPAAINHWISTCLRRDLSHCTPVIVSFADEDEWTLTPQILATAPAFISSRPAPAPADSSRATHPSFPFGHLAAPPVGASLSPIPS